MPRPRALSRLFVPVLALAAALFFSACTTTAGTSGSGQNNGSSNSGGTSNSHSSGNAGSASGASCQTSSSTSLVWSPAGTFGTAPTVVVPSGTPPAQLATQDLIVGTGAIAKAGSSIVVQYVGCSWTTKQKFDASWDHGSTLPFTLGVGQVIPGWDQGVAGMKAGGRRELVIPPSLAYGSNPPTSAIAANDTLVFVVDLVSVG